MVSEDKQMCFLADSPQKVDNIHLAICFPFSFSGLFRLRIAMNVIFFQFPIAQAGSFQRKYTIELMVYCLHLPNLVNACWL